MTAAVSLSRCQHLKRSNRLRFVPSVNGGAPRGRVAPTGLYLNPRARPGFFIGGSNPLPTSYGACGRCELPVGFGAEPRSPKGFPLFSTLRMASPDTIILLIVDYHAAIGGQDRRATPSAPLRTPLVPQSLPNYFMSANEQPITVYRVRR